MTNDTQPFNQWANQLRAHQSVAHQPAPMAPAALCIVSSCNFARHAVVDSRCPGCRWSAPWVGRASPLENGQREDSVRTAQPHNLHATNRVFLPFDDPALDAENAGSWGVLVVPNRTASTFAGKQHAWASTTGKPHRPLCESSWCLSDVLFERCLFL